MTDLASEFVPTLRYATERDIDLLLIEEIKASPEFVAFLLSQLGNPIPGDQLVEWDCKHSTPRLTNRREIDIRVIVTTRAGERLIALLENKLGADEQPEQGESYSQECEVLSKAGRADWVRCGLIAPQSYFSAYTTFASHFDGKIRYETIAAFLADRRANGSPELSRRLEFRIELLDQAVGKRRRGYEPVLVEGIRSFSEHYIRLAESIAPELRPGRGMRSASDKPGDSVSMIFDAATVFASLPLHIRPTRFAHELGRGQEHRANYVAITLPQLGGTYLANKAAFEADLGGTPYKLLARVTRARPNAGLVLYESTPAIDNQSEFHGQRGLNEAGIRAAERLRAWTLANSKIFERWYALGARS